MTHYMTPDFDEPMELVESRRLRYLERLELSTAPPQPRTCPACGHPLPASTPAAGQLTPAERDALVHRIGNLSQAVDEARGPHDDQVIVSAPTKDANVTGAPPPSGYMSREKML